LKYLLAAEELRNDRNRWKLEGRGWKRTGEEEAQRDAERKEETDREREKEREREREEGRKR